MKYNLTRAAFVALGCTLLTVVACGGDDDDDAGTSSSSGGTSSSSGDAAASSSSSGGGGSSSSSGGSSSSSGGTDGGSSSGGGDGGAGPTCQDIDNAVMSTDGRRGECNENLTGEVDGFVRAACDSNYATACTGALVTAVQSYLTCLDAIDACDTEDDGPFEVAVDGCVDAFQNDPALEADEDEACLTVILGD